MAPFLFSAYLVTILIDVFLRYLNLRHLKRHGTEIPDVFEGHIDADLLRRTSAYTLAQSRLSLIEGIFGSVILLLFLFTGLLPAYDRFVSSLTNSFMLQGLFFFLLLILVQEILDIPFSLYRNFRLEARYGFNTMTTKLWLSDLFKSLLISLVLMSLVGGGALALVQVSPEHWWLWVWVFFALITIFLMYLSPYIIEPLFFKFEPVKEEGLEAEVKALMEQAGLSVSRVLQVDASRRSRHSNAYFSGIGKVKRIVLFDTLLEQMRHGEILAVLAHEVGHWKKGHIWKRIVVTEAGALLVIFLSYQLLSWGGLPSLFGLSAATFPAQLVMLGFIISILSFPFTPLSSFFSRRNEWQADRFAIELTGRPEQLASALIKLSKENLANLHPHPLYAAFYYSHPAIVQRVESLLDTETRGEPKQ